MLVLLVLLPLVLGIIHVAVVLHIRNTLTSAATEGARYAATVDRGPEAGVARTRAEIRSALAARYADHVSSSTTTRDGVPVVELRVEADVPPLGLWGPGTHLVVTGHAVEETTP